MATIEVGGHTYSTGRLNAEQQFVVAKRLMPLIADILDLLPTLRASFGTAAASGGEAMAPIIRRLGAAIMQIPDDECMRVFMTCLAATQRKNTSAGWASVVVGGRLMFQDMTLPEMLQITAKVVEENLMGFFTGQGSPSNQ